MGVKALMLFTICQNVKFAGNLSSKGKIKLETGKEDGMNCKYGGLWFAITNRANREDRLDFRHSLGLPRDQVGGGGGGGGGGSLANRTAASNRA